MSRIKYKSSIPTSTMLPPNIVRHRAMRARVFCPISKRVLRTYIFFGIMKKQFLINLHYYSILSSNLIGSKSSNRLYQLHGRKWLRCIEMDSISWDYFGSDYIMLLKTETYAFVWIGRSSSTAERRSALDWVTKLGVNASNVIIVDDGYEQSLPEKLKNQWNSFLPLSQRVVSQVSATPDRQQNNKIKIYKCGYRGTRLHLDQLDVVIPTKEDLSDTSTAYVLDGCLQGIWLWVGNMAPHQDKISAMGNGRAFVKKVCKKRQFISNFNLSRCASVV